MTANPLRRRCVIILLLLFGTVPVQARQFHLLHIFTGGSDGAAPIFTSLVEDRAGNLYGTTGFGGDASCNCGVVFKLTPPYQETVLYRFVGGSDGANPEGGLEKGPDGNFYGTTEHGGGDGCSGQGCGTLFKITPDGTETVLYRFAGGTDGAAPLTRLYADRQGDLFGTTLGGGDPVCQCGTLFELKADGTKTTLHTFIGSDGNEPLSPLVADAQGNLFGSTMFGGPYCPPPYEGCGTVFEYTAAGSYRVVYAFSGTDGQNPRDALTFDPVGNLYGTTGQSTSGNGLIFEIAPDGEEHTRYAFMGLDDGKWPGTAKATSTALHLAAATSIAVAGGFSD